MKPVGDFWPYALRRTTCSGIGALPHAFMTNQNIPPSMTADGIENTRRFVPLYTVVLLYRICIHINLTIVFVLRVIFTLQLHLRSKMFSVCQIRVLNRGLLNVTTITSAGTARELE